MTKKASISFSHMGIHCFELEPMVDFYCSMLELEVADIGVFNSPTGERKIAFLSNDPTEHHLVALVDGRDADADAVLINQISFEVDSLDTLRALKKRLDEDEVEITAISDHCVTWSLYFLDIDGNRIETFVYSPFYVQQPRLMPMDLSLSDAEIEKTTKERFGDDPTFRSLDSWKRDFAKSLGVTV